MLALAQRYEKYTRPLQALLLYIPSMYFLNGRALIAFVAFSLVCFPWKSDKKDWAILLFAAYAALNSLYGALSGHLTEFTLLSSNGISGVGMLLTGYLAARTINATTLKYLLALICAEGLTVLVQASLNRRFFFEGQLDDFANVLHPAYRSISMKTLLALPLDCIQHIYQLEPFGLSRSPAITAAKLLTGITLLLFTPLSHRWRSALFVFLAACIVVLNGRATLIALLITTFLFLGYEIKIRRMNVRDWGWLATCFAAFLITINVTLHFCDGSNLIYNYLGIDNRATAVPVAEKKEPLLEWMSRAGMWTAAYESVLAHPLLGNHSVRTAVFEGKYVNNAYLNILFMHGIIGTALLALFYFRRIFEWPVRFLLLLPLLIICITDDALFWYLSLADILAIYILTIYRGPIFPITHQSDLPMDS